MISLQEISPRRDFLSAPGQGFGPQLSGSEPDVLPLDDPGMYRNYTNLGDQKLTRIFFKNHP